MTNAMEREAVPEPQNPLGIDGIEYIEFATSKPQALVGVLTQIHDGVDADTWAEVKSRTPDLAALVPGS